MTDRVNPDTTFRPLSLTWTIELPRGRRWLLGERLQVMGVLNITPDSFSDGGRYLEPAKALARGLEMITQGADVIDLGAESTRPAGEVYGEGAREVSAQEEMDRLLPVLIALRKESDVFVSVDTRKGAVAKAAIAEGADIINDVSAAKDPEMIQALRTTHCGLIVTHTRGEISDLCHRTDYRDLLDDVLQETAALMRRAMAYRQELFDRIIVDPGIGYSKTHSENLELIRNLDFFRWIDRPVMLSASRKAFIGSLTAAPAPDRLPGSLAVVHWAAQHQVALVRVHDVDETVRFLKVWQAVQESQRRLL